MITEHFLCGIKKQTCIFWTLKKECWLLPINSNETESYHACSSMENGWFSAARGRWINRQTLFCIFWFTWLKSGNHLFYTKRSSLYKRMEETFKTGLICCRWNQGRPRDFARASKKESLKANWIDNRIPVEVDSPDFKYMKKWRGNTLLR